MSSKSGGRRSMDDVLSSIRRIIGADKREDDDGEFHPEKYDVPRSGGTRPGGGPDEEPMRLGASLGGDMNADAEPLSLSPEMREGEAPIPLGQPIGRGDADPSDNAPVPMPVRGGAAAPAPVEETGGDAVVIDEAALEDMIRRVVRDELTQTGPGDEMIRQIIHEELSGDIGQRISANVRRLIQDEVSRLLRDPG